MAPLFDNVFMHAGSTVGMTTMTESPVCESKHVLHLSADATVPCRRDENIIFSKEKSPQPSSVEGRLL